MLAEPCGTTAEPHTPYKGSATGSVPRAAPLTGQGHFDLTGTWSKPTADLIRDAWITKRDGTDPEPIRQAYRDNAHEGFRAVLAAIMTGGGK